ncbi:fibroblast growth factor receptor homolog 1-like isoform 1-T2 [Clarias gariepinus]|uniref:fibroblast growth factor receptor homolog 1-like n=1 Tax=Clarias gariepinus TaxID=13013 RepID=UPI00234D0B0F|nr:fibroblast growth factor receptor homolog 1-like [Clarias gariepinus]XP_053331755.1 fibroblast growth factor receptor homolog 1-like [Clarias gariepinus]
MYSLPSRQNTSMASNYSTTITPANATTIYSPKKDFHKCENSSDGEGLLIGVIVTVYTSIFLIVILAITWLKKYQNLRRRIRTLEKMQQQTTSLAFAETEPLEQRSRPERMTTVQLEEKASEIKSASPSFNKADITMQQLIKAGREGMLYKAKMTHGAIKGHTMFTCKIYKKAARYKLVKREVLIMQNLNKHKNLLQLIDWDITEVPYMLIMEDVELGSLRTFLRVNKERLCKDEELQHLFTIALYHIAKALDHLHSKMILHCNLSLRNIMVNRFPHEVKVAEFGLARDIRRGQRHSRNGKKKDSKRVPFRWYPPEYFKNDLYGFKGDVWAFGIVIWEIQTFGSVPYPDLKTPEEVVSYVCAGQRSQEPEKCRPEVLQMMRDCWQEPYSMRPSFTDIGRVLGNTLEHDRDYVDMDNSNVIGSVDYEDEDY